MGQCKIGLVITYLGCVWKVPAVLAACAGWKSYGLVSSHLSRSSPFL